MPEIRSLAPRPSKAHRESVVQDNKTRRARGAWLAHTYLKLKTGYTYAKIDLKPQTAKVYSVVEHAIEVASQLLVFGYDEHRDLSLDTDTLRSMTTPMEMPGMQQMAIDSLHESAEQLKFTGKYDILDRLTRDEYKDYAKPLAAVVSL